MDKKHMDMQAQMRAGGAHPDRGRDRRPQSLQYRRPSQGRGA
jgi:hypothetical protein